MPSSPSPKPYSAVDGRMLLGVVLWGFGLGLALVGNWLRWDWWATLAPEPFPNQVWGDIASSNAENGLVLIELLASVAVVVLWWLTGSARRHDPGSSTRRHLANLGTTLKWLMVVLTGAAIAAIGVLLLRYLHSWWNLFPGWLAQFFAQISIFVGALTLPPFAGPHRSQEREKHGPAKMAAVLGVLAVALLPYPVERLVTGTQVSFRSLAHHSSDPVRVEVVNRSDGWVGAGAVGIDQSQETEVWERIWRGARDAKLLPSASDETALLELLQATPNRPALVVLNAEDGNVQAQLTAEQLEALDIDTIPNPQLDRYLFVDGVTLLRSGASKEWVTLEGQRLNGPPRDFTESSRSRMTPSDGVHALDLLTGDTWFIGDGGGCIRRVAASDEGPIAAEDGTVTMVQICDEHASPEPGWSYPDDLIKATEPLTATLLGVNPQDGSVLWTTQLEGFTEWVAITGARFPSADYRKLPIELRMRDGVLTATFNGKQTVVDIATGQVQ